MTWQQNDQNRSNKKIDQMRNDQIPPIKKLRNKNRRDKRGKKQKGREK